MDPTRATDRKPRFARARCGSMLVLLFAGLSVGGWPVLAVERPDREPLTPAARTMAAAGDGFELPVRLASGEFLPAGTLATNLERARSAAAGRSRVRLLLRMRRGEEATARRRL